MLGYFLVEQKKEKYMWSMLGRRDGSNSGWFSLFVCLFFHMEEELFMSEQEFEPLMPKAL